MVSTSPYRVLCVLLIAVLGVGGTEQPVWAQTPVNGITFSRTADSTGYVVRIHADARIAAYSMPEVTDEAHVKWTLYNATLGRSAEQETPSGPIAQYDATESDGHLTLRLALNGERAVQANAYRDRASDDLLLNLTYADAAPPSQTAPPAMPVASEESDDRERNRSARWRLDTVVIDPGHGGKDPGTQGHGIREKDLVLDVAKILGGYLEDKLGIRVVYTRTDDQFIELRERGRIANEAGGKLFISLHANATRAASARGTETFFLGQHKTESARRVMERENRVVNLEDNAGQYEALDEERLVRYALTQSANMRQSEYLAALVEEQFDERVHRKSRGVKQAGFQVLWEASMPAVLIELGFLTHANEARFLTSENGKVYLASAIFRAVRDYKAEYEKGMNIARKNE